MVRNRFATGVPIPFLLLLLAIVSTSIRTQNRLPEIQPRPRPTGTPSITPTGQWPGTENILSKRCDPESIDLSDTFTGQIDFPDRSLKGTSTLEITKDKFTLTVGNTKLGGNITVTQRCDELFIALTFVEDYEVLFRSKSAPRGISLHAQACGNGNALTLTAVPEDRNFVFTELPALGKNVQCRPYCRRRPCPHMPPHTTVVIPTPRRPRP